MIPNIQPVIPSAAFITNTNHYCSYSAKLSRFVDTYSWPERMNQILLEFDRSVDWYCEQPIRVNERIGGRQFCYTPDTLVSRHSLMVYQEVKPSRRLINYDGLMQPYRWPRIKQWAELHDNVIEFVTDEDILSDRLRLRNLLILAPFMRASQFYDDPGLRRRLRSDIHGSAPVPISKWVSRYDNDPPTAVVSALSILYQQGQCRLSLSERLLTPNTTVFPSAA